MATRQQVEGILGHLSIRSLKHWLKVNKLVHTASNEDKFYALVLNLIQKGELTLGDLRTAALSIEESGGKRIYLRSAVPPDKFDSLDSFRTQIRSKGLEIDDSPNKSIKFPQTPRLNYLCWIEEGERKEIRIKFSETHEDVGIDKRTQNRVRSSSTKFIVFIMDVRTGFSQFRFDQAEPFHSHKDANGIPKTSLFEGYYFQRIKDILGVDFEPFNLTTAITNIIYAEPRIFRIPREKVTASGNAKQVYSCDTDVRDILARQGAAQVDGTNWLEEDIAGYWLPEPSNNALQRELFMRLLREPSMIRFLADCTEQEVDYALSRIRTV